MPEMVPKDVRVEISPPSFARDFPLHREGPVAFAVAGPGRRRSSSRSPLSPSTPPPLFAAVLERPPADRVVAPIFSIF